MKSVRLGNFIEEHCEKNKKGEDIPVFSVTNTNGFCTEYFSKDVSSKDKSNYKIVHKGFFAYNPSRINVGSVDWLRNEEKVIVSPLYNVFSVSPELEKQYLYYFLKSERGKTLIKSKAEGSVRDNLKFSILADFPIPLPSIEEQQKFVAKLDKASELILKYKRLLEYYDSLIKSRFIEMFGDPVQNPMGWEVKKLGKMCSAIMNGTTPKGGEQVYVENGITFLRSQNVWRNKIDLDDVAYIDEATHKSMKKSSLKKYDILMTKTGRINTENSSLGRAALFLGEDDSANINGHVYLIRLEKEYNHEFVIRILTSPEYRDYIRSICVGGIDKRQVNKDHIEKFPIIQPPKELQDEYSAFVQQIDKSKFTVQKSLEKAETLYKSLMQQYFA